MWLKWRLQGCVLLFLVAHLLLGWVSIPSLWWMNPMAYAPRYYAVVFLLGTMLLSGFYFRPATAKVLLRSMPDPWRPGGWGWGVRLCVSGMALTFL